MIFVIILMFIVGSLLFVCSFLFTDAPVKEDEAASNRSLERIMENSFEEIQQRLDQVVEKSAGNVKDQTERELEKISNEKIMAVSEYSDQVINEINKNHQEVMFLYNVLNDKHKEVDNTVEKVHRTKRLKEEEKKVMLTRQEKADAKIASKSNQSAVESPNENLKEEKSDKEKYNKKENILQLHGEGKSNLEIAKILDIGIGEVRLVIDLQRTADGQEVSQ